MPVPFNCVHSKCLVYTEPKFSYSIVHQNLKRDFQIIVQQLKEYSCSLFLCSLHGRMTPLDHFYIIGPSSVHVNYIPLVQAWNMERTVGNSIIPLFPSFTIGRRLSTPLQSGTQTLF